MFAVDNRLCIRCPSLNLTMDDNDLKLKCTKVIAISAMVMALTGCTLLTPYQPELKQGNFVKDQQLRQIQPGMTREQVSFLLGSPMVTGEQPQNRWIYPVLEADGSYRNLIVEFDDGRVVGISEG